MSPTLDAFLRSWPHNPWLLLWLVVAGLVYLRGWCRLHARDPLRWHGGRLSAFLGGLATIFLALGSPIESFATLLLQVHMVQHVLLMMLAAPLIWLGAPFFPMLQGLPAAIRREWVAPVIRSLFVRNAFAQLTHPVVALPVYVLATWAWHVPAAYQAALEVRWLHYVQHAAFLAAALIFWYPVVRPFPARPRWSLWLLLPYLLLADIQNTVLSGLLSFASRPLYAFYEAGPLMPGMTPLADQQAAGAIMWVPGSVAFSIPLFAIGVQLLLGKAGTGSTSDRGRGATSKRPLRLPVVAGSGDRPARPGTTSAQGFDLLRVPVAGPFLRWRFARPALQIPLAVLALVVVIDGICGPGVGALNLAGVLPWIHWRGAIILTLLVAGNFFCLVCPFTLARNLGRRWLPAGWQWPRRLRSKWLAVVLVGVFLWAYEAFSLWDRPLWTAWIAGGYFLAAFAVDGLFRGGTFCKYVCPIGQFQFVQSLVSPLEVRVRSADVCSSCQTKECIRGGERSPGCELQLYLPRKSSNMDCTFCLDCIHACPHDNIGMLATPPVASLWQERFRSGIGPFAKRPDLAVLIVVLTFGAVANAAGMVGPVVAVRDQLGELLGESAHWIASSLFYVAALVVVPAITIAVATWLSRWCGGLRTASLEVATRFSFSLVPLGFGVWLAHYSFHFLTSFDSIVPTTQRFVQDFLGDGLGEPDWLLACCRPTGDWLLRTELLALDIGLLASLYAAWRIAGNLRRAPGNGRSAGVHEPDVPPAYDMRTLGMFVPWAMLLTVLFAVAVWIVFQPMEMRGTLPG